MRSLASSRVMRLFSSRSVFLRSVSLGWLSGLLAGYFFAPSLLAVVVLLTAATLVILPWRNQIGVLHFLIALVFVCGVLRISAFSSDLFHGAPLSQRVESSIGQHVQFTAVADEILPSSPGNVRFIARALPPHEGYVSVRSRALTAVRYGSVVVIEGDLAQPLDTVPAFSLRQYLASKQVYAVMDDAVVTDTGDVGVSSFLLFISMCRERILDSITFLFPARSAALLSGLLLGMKGSFSHEFLNDLQVTGLTHIVALSGFNITILISFIAGILLRGSRRLWRFLGSVAAIVFFILLAGPSASVVRAAIMGVLALLALSVGRKADLLTMLLLSLVAMTMIHPVWLFQDVGFQLSFLATLGIILFIPLFEHSLFTKKRLSFLTQALGATLAAQIMTFPILLFHFGSISLIAPVTNLLVVAVVPATMLLGAVPVLLSLIPFLDSIALILAFLANIPLVYIAEIVTVFARFPGAAVHLYFWDARWMIAAYGVIGVLYWRGRVTSNK